MSGSEGRRALRLAQLLLVAAAGGLWAASRLPWLVIRTADGLGQPRQVVVSGAAWSTALVPLALLCLAAAGAAVAVHGWKLRMLAGLTAAASLAGGYLAIGLWAARDIELRALDVAGVPLTALLSTDRRPAGAVVTLAAAVCAIGGAALLMRCAAASAATVGRYAAPGDRRAAARDAGRASESTLSEQVIWDALDEGYDPTDTPPDGVADEGR